ncbi:MAG: sporulation transcriptional regulator SpoIIID [Ruminiclostridium sp.]|nr:sporulation transcriptional regulator SpoIIID [Ruminiclostridium sp.]
MSYIKSTGTGAAEGSKQERCVSLAQYMIDNKATVRTVGKVFGISKSTVHQDITVRLERIDPELHRRVREILEQNKQERHIRGGLATKRKYSLQKSG